MWSLGRWKRKIQEASEDFTEGEIMFPSFKTSYIKENTSTGEENGQNNTENALKHSGAP